MQVPAWLTREVFLISFSAFFADLGYQAVVGLLPIYVTGVLNQPPYVFGTLMALTYGIGAVVSYTGGRVGDYLNKRKVALAGNILIPLLSFSGLPSNIFASGGLYMGGWFARNFRSPPRRAMLVEASDPTYRSNAFGFLHLLDVGGGTVSASVAFLLLRSGFGVGEVMLFSILPILASSVVLFMTRGEKHPSYVSNAGNVRGQEKGPKGGRLDRRLFMAAVALFGFSSYSLGFPIITVSSETGSYSLGIATYAVYLCASGLVGYAAGSFKGSSVGALWKFGYAVAAAGSLFLALSYHFHAGIAGFYLSTALLGAGTGVIETYEPVVTALTVPHSRLSRGLGSLSQWRGAGLFISNLLMGLLFTVSIFSSYIYAFATASAGTLLLAIVQFRGNVG